ncbi:nucleoid disruption protein [Morganella phage vB_Mm5]
MSKITLHYNTLFEYGKKIGKLNNGIFTNQTDHDMKSVGFYFVVARTPNNTSKRALFRFYVAPNQRTGNGANRTLGRIRNSETTPASMVAQLSKAEVYYVDHASIKHLFGVKGIVNSEICGRLNLQFGDGENYTDWNRALNDIYKFEYQTY